MIDSDPRAQFLAGMDRAARHWLVFWTGHAHQQEALLEARGHALRALAWCATCDGSLDVAIDLALAMHGHMMWLGGWHEWQALLWQLFARASVAADPERQFALRHHISTICWRLHRLDESIALSEENQRWAISAGDRPRQLQVAMGLAETYLNAEAYDRALACAEEVAALAATLNALAQEADGLIDAARALLGLDELAEAERRLQRALSLAAAAGDVTYHAKAQLFIGHAAARGERWDEALRWFEAALELVASYGDEVGCATIKSHIGCALMEFGRWDEARRLLEEAVRVHRRCGNLPAEQLARQRLRELETRRAAAYHTTQEEAST
ncbi:MAG: hypothetical protein AUK03_05730 [Anaerolineae bacterium CG2_30_64_16]|nr:MAG: hypothetical protein AUK03_05730 [Anaerolineae bacterium CG2_30_64_16]